MKDHRLLEDPMLADAFRSVRDAYDGESLEANLTLQRALFRTRTRERRQRFARWIVLPAAALLAASTVWAGVTGHLPAWRSVLETFHADRPAPTTMASPVGGGPSSTSTPSVPSTPVATTEAPTVDPAPREPDPAPEPARAAPIDPPMAHAPPPPSARRAPPAAPPMPPAGASEPATRAPAPATVDDPHAGLFAEAHRLHFTEKDPARALAAWDRYLDAAPTGRFAPEAHYNRALTLIRLGRRVEAQNELSAFATGAYGDYRRAEAKALLDAL